MITPLSYKEVRKHNKELVAWLRQELEGKHRNKIYNVVLMLKSLVEDL